MREYIENNQEIVEELLRLDNHIMHASVTIEELLEHALEESSYSFHNALLIYDGNPFTTIKIMNSEITNCTLYPNHSYLGINRFLTSYKEDVTLSTLKNDFSFEEKQAEYEHIYVINAKDAFYELKTIYKNAIYIEI